MNSDIYQQIEERAAEVRRLRSLLQQEETEFRRLVDQAARGRVHQAPSRQTPPLKVDQARRKGSRMSDETRKLLDYLRDTRTPDRGAMAKILMGEDSPEARRYTAQRLSTLKQREFIRETPSGGLEVIWEDA